MVGLAPPGISSGYGLPDILAVQPEAAEAVS